MATNIEVSFARSKELPSEPIEGRLQIIEGDQTEAYLGTESGWGKLTDISKADLINEKVDPSEIPFGETENTVYEGSAGKQNSDDIESLQESVRDLETVVESTYTKEDTDSLLAEKANTDGFYEDLSVGYADVAGTIARNPNSAIKESFLHRATGGTRDVASEAPATYNYIEGKTWVENQLLAIPVIDISETKNNVALADNRDGKYILTSVGNPRQPASADTDFVIGSVQVKSGHVYAVTGISPVKPFYNENTIPSASTFCIDFDGQLDIGYGTIYTANSDKTVDVILHVGVNTIITASKAPFAGVVPNVIDLTVWYHNNVPSAITIAAFQKEFGLIGNKYVTENAGTVKSSLPSTILNRNKNLLQIDASVRTEEVKKGDSPYAPTSIRNLNENQIWVGISGNYFVGYDAIQSYSTDNQEIKVLHKDAGWGIGYGLGFPIKAIPNTKYTYAYDESNFARVGVAFYNASGVFKRHAAIDANNPYIETFDDETWIMIQFASSDAIDLEHAFAYRNPILCLYYETYGKSYEFPKVDSFAFNNFGSGLNKIGSAIDTSWIITSGTKENPVYTQYVKRNIGIADMDELVWSEEGGIYSTTISDIASDTANIFAKGYDSILVSGTTVSITSSTTPTGTLYYELATPEETTYTISSDWSCTAWDLGTEQFEFGNSPSPCEVTLKTLYAWNANDALKNMVSVHDIDDEMPTNPSNERVPSTKLLSEELEKVLPSTESLSNGTYRLTCTMIDGVATLSWVAV